MRPASMREKSRRVLTSLSSRSAFRCTTSQRSAVGRRQRVRAARAHPRVGPSIRVSGVRNSWLTLLKNAVLARSISASASARALASARARALEMAVAIWPATSARKLRYLSSKMSRGLMAATSTPVGRPSPGWAMGRTATRCAGRDSASGRAPSRISRHTGCDHDAERPGDDSPTSDRSAPDWRPCPARFPRRRRASPASHRHRADTGARTADRLDSPRSRAPRRRRPPRRWRPSGVRAESSCKVLRRRAPSTRSVVSVTVTSTPPTSPPSSRMGL